MSSKLPIERIDVVNPSKAARRAFDCGDESLNTWLARQAGQSMRTQDAVTFVMHDGDEILGYYCATTASVERDDLVPGRRRGAPDPAPAITVGRLAVAKKAQGRRLGNELLRHAIRGALVVNEKVGVRCLLVHAIDEDARGFYEHHGFERSPINPFTLTLDLASVRRSLEG